jgi:cytochrome c oxidase cbb3-type subunit 2
MNHDIIEKNIGLMVVLIIIAVAWGGLAEIVPLFGMIIPTNLLKVLCH